MRSVPQAGEEIPRLEKEPIGKLQLLHYAGASGDDNLIHVDAETAHAAGLPGVIAHGMLSMGFLGQLLTDWAGAGAVLSISVRFSRMVGLGDRLTCRGVVRGVREEPGGAVVRLLVYAENQAGERVTEGDAEVFLQH